MCAKSLRNHGKEIMKMEMVMKKKLFRPDEVAKILCLSRRTIYRMIRDGRLPAVRHGAGPWRIYQETLLTLLPSPLGETRRASRELPAMAAAPLRGAA
jgi:excisionase family DNA binding protein